MITKQTFYDVEYAPAKENGWTLDRTFDLLSDAQEYAGGKQIANWKHRIVKRVVITDREAVQAFAPYDDWDDVLRGALTIE